MTDTIEELGMRGTVNPFPSAPTASVQDILAQLAAAVNLPSTSSINNPRYGDNIPHNFMALDRRTEIPSPSTPAPQARRTQMDRLQSMIRALNGSTNRTVHDFDTMNNFRDLLHMFGGANATLGNRLSPHFLDIRGKDNEEIPRSSSTGP